jgi:hypothetical protein
VTFSYASLPASVRTMAFPHQPNLAPACREASQEEVDDDAILIFNGGGDDDVDNDIINSNGPTLAVAGAWPL